MQQILTAKLKLLATPEQVVLLRKTQLAYRDALNYVSRYAFAHGKLSNTERLQKGTYQEIRVLFHLPSQMACYVPRQVAGTYKGLWTKLMQNLARGKDSCSFAATQSVLTECEQVDPTSCTPIWLVRAISRCERFSSGKTG